MIKKISLIIILIACTLPLNSVYATNTGGGSSTGGASGGPIAYVPLTPLPGIDTTQGVDVMSYIRSMYVFAIGFSIVLAIFMIVLGGLQYMSTDAISKKSEGKQTIQNALWGLFLVMASWLILYTINPAFVGEQYKPNIETIRGPDAAVGIIAADGQEYGVLADKAETYDGASTQKVYVIKGADGSAAPVTLRKLGGQAGNPNAAYTSTACKSIVQHEAKSGRNYKCVELTK